MEAVEGQGSEKIPWAKVSAVEALAEEVSRLWRAIETHLALLLELSVKLWQGNMVEDPERELGEFLEDGPGAGIYCECLVSN